MVRIFLSLLFSAILVQSKAQFQINHKDDLNLRGTVEFCTRESSTLYCANGFSYMNDTFSVSHEYIVPNHQTNAGRDMFVPVTSKPVYYAFNDHGRTTMEGIQNTKNECNWTMVKYDSLGRVSYELFEIIFEDEDEKELLFSMEQDIDPRDREPASEKPTTFNVQYKVTRDKNKNPVSRTWFKNNGDVAWKLVYRPDSITPEINVPTTKTDLWEVQKNDEGLPSQETGFNADGENTRTIKIEYDENNYPMAEYWLNANGHLHLTWNYLYCPDGKLLQLEVIKDKNILFQWLFAYSEKGDILSVTRKTNGQTTTWSSAYEYDDHGNWFLQYQYKNHRPKYGITRRISYY